MFLTVIAAAVAFTADVWDVRDRLLERATRYELHVVAVLLSEEDGSIADSEGLIEVGIHTFNSSEPQSELHNLFVTVWAFEDHLVAVRHDGHLGEAERGRGRRSYTHEAAVVPKRGVGFLVTWVFRAPTQGEEILFGCVTASRETPHEQYLWKIVNQEGRPRLVIVDTPREYR